MGQDESPGRRLSLNIKYTKKTAHQEIDRESHPLESSELRHELERQVGDVLSDLLARVPNDVKNRMLPDLSVDLLRHDDEFVEIMTWLDGGYGAGFQIDPADTAATILFTIADTLQDFVCVELRAAVPLCPGHQHPLQASLEDQSALWRCPQDREHFSCRVGEYASATVGLRS